MKYMEEYSRWLESDIVSAEDKEILRNYSDAEIEEFFDSPLNFGTAGIRKKMFLGSGALNKYTVAHITRGVCDFVLSQGKANPSVVIAYDSRHNSKEFAELASRVLAAKCIHVFLYEDIRPTPELSFAVRYSQSAAGINITASHNTKEYNGYKVYGPDGIQLSPEEAAQVVAVIDGNDVLNPPEEMDFDKAVESGAIELINGYFDSIYLAQVLSQSKMTDEMKEIAKDMKIVYTAFHGTGSVFVPRVLERDGFEKVICEPAQIIPNGDFPTVESPNPETVESFRLAIELAEKEGADLVIGTDPDGDRCGIAVRTSKGFSVLTGNQIGVLLLDYLIKSKISKGDVLGNAYAVKSIVSTKMANKICQVHGIEMVETLTGFKYIGEVMEELSVNQGREFILGFEESNGYLTGLYARDKDAILASMLIAETACYHKYSGRNLIDGLDSLYKEYGYYKEKTLSMAGSDDGVKISDLMSGLRANPPSNMGDLRVTSIVDYLKDDTGLPKSDVLAYELEGGHSIIVRPSGTEPKIKVYLSSTADSEKGAKDILDKLEAYTSNIIGLT